MDNALIYLHNNHTLQKIQGKITAQDRQDKLINMCNARREIHENKYFGIRFLQLYLNNLTPIPNRNNVNVEGFTKHDKWRS